jgi:hypothetical protein
VNISFLFLDECQSEPLDSLGTRISSLTGLLIPAERYAGLRDQFYSALTWSTQPSEGVVKVNPPELHGRDLLRGESDERKLAVLQRVVELVVDGQVIVYRVGYYVTPRLKQAFSTDKRLLGICWFGILAQLQPVLAERGIVPIMDMADRELARILSTPIRTMDVMRARGHADNLSLLHTENLFGEVYYADSRYSAFMQVADLVSYLLHSADMHREGKDLSDFRRMMVALSDALHPAVSYDQIIALKFDGQPQRPRPEVTRK